MIRQISRLGLFFMALCLSAGAGAESPSKSRASAGKKVYAIVTVTVRPGKDAEYVAMLADDVALHLG